LDPDKLKKREQDLKTLTKYIGPIIIAIGFHAVLAGCTWLPVIEQHAKDRLYDESMKEYHSDSNRRRSLASKRRRVTLEETSI